MKANNDNQITRFTREEKLLIAAAVVAVVIVSWLCGMGYDDMRVLAEGSLK